MSEELVVSAQRSDSHRGRRRSTKDIARQCAKGIVYPFILTVRLTQTASKRAKLVIKLSPRRGSKSSPVESINSLWKDLPQRENGTIITGRLSPEECSNFSSPPDSPISVVPYEKTPQLPPEIWREIIRHACDTYSWPLSIHDMSVQLSIETPGVACIELRRRLHKSSMKNKVVLSTVSKEWRKIALPYLYESVRITRYEQAQQLISLFDEDAKCGRVGSDSKAWWVRELWFDSNICTCQSDPETRGSIARLTRCPRLVSFRKLGKFDCSIDNQEESCLVLENLLVHQSPCADGFTRGGAGVTGLEWAFGSTNSFQHFLAAHPSMGNMIPHVRSLELRPSFAYIFEELNENSEPSTSLWRHDPIFPDLEFVCLLGSSAFSQAVRFGMPKLRSLTLFSSAFDGPSAELSLQRILQEHGEKLEELELDSTWFTADAFDLTGPCHNLKRLQIPTSMITLPEPPNIRHETITTLGLRGLHRIVPENQHSQFIEHLMARLESFPGVKVVQDLSIKSEELRQRAVALWSAQDALVYRNFWGDCISTLERKGITLTCWDGTLVKGFEDRRRLSLLPSEADQIAQGLICSH